MSFLKTANPILNKALKGIRITQKEALELFDSASSLDLAYSANEIRRRLHPDDAPTTYVIQRNINYSNVCTAHCSFCAFYTPPNSTTTNSSDVKFPEAYVHDYQTILKPKIQEDVCRESSSDVFNFQI